MAYWQKGGASWAGAWGAGIVSAGKGGKTGACKGGVASLGGAASTSVGLGKGASSFAASGIKLKPATPSVGAAKPLLSQAVKPQATPSSAPGVAAAKKPLLTAAAGAAAGATTAAVGLKATYNVTSKKSMDELVVRTVVGTYVEESENHGRKVFKKQESIEDYPELTVFMYYWDDRDGEDFSGWWFGDQVGGTQVFAQCANHGTSPPKVGWKVPWDAPKVEIGALLVEPKQGLMPSAKAKAKAKATPGAATTPAKVATPPATAPPASAFAAAGVASAAMKAEFQEIVEAQTAQVEEAIASAKDAMEKAKAAVAGDEGAEYTPVDALKLLQDIQELLKTSADGLAEEMKKARFIGPSASTLVIALSKLQPKLRSSQGMLTIELNKVRAPIVRAEAQERIKKAKEAKAKQEAEQAAKEMEELIPKALDASSAAEDAVESVSILADPLMNDVPTTIDDEVTKVLADIEKCTIDAHNKVTAASRVVSQVLITVKKRAATTDTVNQSLQELTTMKVRLEAFGKKLVLYKKFKAEFQQKMKSQLALKALSDKIADSEVEVEKTSVTVVGKQGEALSAEEVASLEAALPKAQAAIGTCMRAVEVKLKSPIEPDQSKEELKKMLERCKECSAKVAAQLKELAGHKEAAKRGESLRLCKEKVAKAEELVAKCEDTEAPFKTGVAAMTEEDSAKAIKAAETATALAEKSIGQARGFIKQKIMDAKRLPEEHAAVAEQELNELVDKVDELAKKLSAMSKETFEVKYSTVMSDVLPVLTAAEAKIVELQEETEALNDESMGAESMKEAAETAQPVEKEASQAIQEAKKALDAKIKELKGKSAGAVAQMQGRLQVVTQDLSKLRKLTTGVDKIIKTRSAVAEEEKAMKEIEVKVQNVDTMAKDSSLSDEAALELETMAVEAVKVLKTAEKTLADLAKAATSTTKETVDDLISRNRKAVKTLEEARASTKGKRDEAVGKAFVKEVEKRIAEVDAALDAAGDAELPFLSGVEVLPVDEATETLAKCDKAGVIVAGLISKTRTYVASKTVEIRKIGTESAKSAVEEVTAMQEKLKTAAERLTRYKKDISGHRKKADMNAAVEKLAEAETEVEQCKETAKSCEAEDMEKLTAEEATSMCEKVSEECSAAQTKLDKVSALLLARQKDVAKEKEEQEVLKGLKERLDKAIKELAEASKVATVYEQKFVAKQLLSSAKGKLQAADDEIASVTKACAPLIEEGGEPFLVQAALQFVVTALTQHMAETEGITKEDLFKKANGGKATGSISEDAFGEFIAGLNDWLGREDLDFAEDRRKAMYKLVAGDADGICEEAFQAMFIRRYAVVKNVSLTSNLEVGESKTVNKLEVGDVLEALGEAKKDDSSGLLRMECKLVAKGTTGWVTTQGNQGTVFLEVVSPYTTFLKDIGKKINAVSQANTAVLEWFKSSVAQLGTATDPALKEARNELGKLKPQAIEKQTKLNKLKQQMGVGQKEFEKKQAAERNAHVEKKERLEAEAITGPVNEKCQAAMVAMDKLAECSKPVMSLKAQEQKEFPTPMTCQKECDDAAAVLAEAVKEATAAAQEALAKLQKATGTGPLAEAKKSILEMKKKVDAASAKRHATVKAIAAVCKTIGEAAYTKLTQALREEVQALGVSLDTYFDKLAGDKSVIDEEALCNHLQSMDGLAMQSEHAALACRRLGSGSVSRRRFTELLQVYYTVIKEIALTASFEIGADKKPIRKAEINEVFELLEGPQTEEESQMKRIRARSVKDGTECWITLTSNKGTSFLKECPKPYLALAKDVALEKDMAGKEGPVKTLKAEQILEVVEGPSKLQGALDDAMRARVKASKDNAQGFLTTRDEFGTVFAELSDTHFTCAAVIGITNEFDMSICKVIRKLVVGEVVETLSEPQEDEEKKIKRVKCRALKDDVEGWVPMTGAKDTTAYFKPSTKHYVIRQEATLNKQASANAQAVRTLEEGEVIEVLVGPKAEKVEPALRVKGRVLGDDEVVGWFAVGAARPCKPSYKCKKAAPLHETIDNGADAKVVRQLEVDETLELIELGGGEAEVFRIKVRAEKDGIVGWVTVKDKGVTYVAAASP